MRFLFLDPGNAQFSYAREFPAHGRLGATVLHAIVPRVQEVVNRTVAGLPFVEFPHRRNEANTRENATADGIDLSGSEIAFSSPWA